MQNFEVSVTLRPWTTTGKQLSFTSKIGSCRKEEDVQGIIDRYLADRAKEVDPETAFYKEIFKEAEFTVRKPV